MTSDEVAALLGKARENLGASALLLKHGYLGVSISRSYYAMFYAAEAALLSLGLTFSKHSGVISAFGQHLARPERVPAYLHRHLLEAYDLRQMSDYDAPSSISMRQAEEALARATEFVNSLEAFLAVKPPPLESPEGR